MAKKKEGAPLVRKESPLTDREKRLLIEAQLRQKLRASDDLANATFDFLIAQLTQDVFTADFVLDHGDSVRQKTDREIAEIEQILIEVGEKFNQLGLAPSPYRLPLPDQIILVESDNNQTIGETSIWGNVIVLRIPKGAEFDDRLKRKLVHELAHFICQIRIGVGDIDLEESAWSKRVGDTCVIVKQVGLMNLNSDQTTSNIAFSESLPIIFEGLFFNQPIMVIDKHNLAFVLALIRKLAIKLEQTDCQIFSRLFVANVGGNTADLKEIAQFFGDNFVNKLVELSSTRYNTTVSFRSACQAADSGEFLTDFLSLLHEFNEIDRVTRFSGFLSFSAYR